MSKKLLFFITTLSIIIFSGCAKEKKQLNLSAITISNEKDKLSSTTLHEAVRVNDLDLVKAFIEKKVDLNKKDKYGYTPLHLAAIFNHYKIARELILNNALIDTQDKFLDSPLIDSTKKGYTKISKLLICNGANINISDKNGFKPLDYALKVNDITVAKLIKSNNKKAQCLGYTIKEKISPSLITIDNYEIVKTNKPEICGDILDLDVRQVQITLDKGKTAIEAEINNKKWCAKIENELQKGTYNIWVMAINSKGQTEKKELKLIIE